MAHLCHKMGIVTCVRLFLLAFLKGVARTDSSVWGKLKNKFSGELPCIYHLSFYFGPVDF